MRKIPKKYQEGKNAGHNMNHDTNDNTKKKDVRMDGNGLRSQLPMDINNNITNINTTYHTLFGLLSHRILRKLAECTTNTAQKLKENHA